MSRRETVVSCLTHEWQSTSQILEQAHAKDSGLCRTTQIFRILDSERRYRLVEKSEGHSLSGRASLWRLPSDDVEVSE